MKKYFMLIAVAATVLTVSCKKAREVENPTQQPGQTTAIDDSVPAPVLFGSNMAAVKSPIMTKGLGGIDEWKGAQQKLYIYGLERKKNVNPQMPDYHIRSSFTTPDIYWLTLEQYNADHETPIDQAAFDALTDEQKLKTAGSAQTALFIDNVAADAPAGGNTIAQDINVYNKWVTNRNESYYYSGEKVYDFVGYFVDDAVLSDDETPVVLEPAPKVNNVTVSGTTITVGDEDGAVVDNVIAYIAQPNLTLDGTQDIMLAETDKDADWVSRTEYVGFDLMYSAKTARRGIKPNLIFKHQLSRFEFHIFNGHRFANQAAVTADEENQNGILNTLTVKGISLASPTWKNTGDLIIFSDDVHVKPCYLPDEYSEAELTTIGNDDSKYNYLHLHDAAGDPLTPKNPKALINGQDVTLSDDNKIGESILIVPGDDIYKLGVTISQTGMTGTDTQYYDLDMSTVTDQSGNPIDEDVALAGKKYIVTLIVYGPEEVKISVTLTEWEDRYIVKDLDEIEGGDTRMESIISVNTAAEDYSTTVAKGAELDFGKFVSSDNKYSALEFTSSDTGVFTVDANTGVITGVEIGTATLHIDQPQSVSHLAAETKDVTITVTADTRAQLTITTDDTIQMPVTDSKGYPSTKRIKITNVMNGSTDVTSTFVNAQQNYKLLNDAGVSFAVTAGQAYATVDSQTGVVTAVAAGVATVTITIAEKPGAGGWKATTKEVIVIVGDDARTVTTLNGVPDADVNLALSGTHQISVTVQASSTDLDPQPTITYSSSNPDVASVDGDGLVTASTTTTGSAIITISFAGNATYKPVHDTFTVNVTE